MNKCKILFLMIFSLLFVEFANAKKTELKQFLRIRSDVADCYKAGCEALDGGKIEKAGDNFLKGLSMINNMIAEGRKSMHSMEYMKNMRRLYVISPFGYDVRRVKDAAKAPPSGNNWWVYYYKGLLEAIIFDHKNYLGTDRFIDNVSDNFSKELAIATLKQSISLYDNYQSHFVLYLLGVEDERDKALQVAADNGYNEAAGNIEYEMGKYYEEKKKKI